MVPPLELDRGVKREYSGIRHIVAGFALDASLRTNPRRKTPGARNPGPTAT